MERAAVGAGGVAVKTRETEPPVEQLATQPPPEPLQAARIEAMRTRSRAVGARRMLTTPFVNSAAPGTWRSAGVDFSGAAREAGSLQSRSVALPRHSFLPMYAATARREAQ